MSDKKLTRRQVHGWGKTYVVYNIKHDLLGLHMGPKFLDLGGGPVLYWPHDIDHGGMTSLLCDENFREYYIYVGEL